jgi:hypothetical protein
MFGILTLSCLDISSVRQVSLHTDDNVLEMREMDRGQDIVCDALLEQNCGVCGEFWACGKRCGEGGGIVVPCGVRDNVSGPSQSKRHGRQSGGKIQETHGRVMNDGQDGGILRFVGCWLGFEFRAFNKYQRPDK